MPPTQQINEVGSLAAGVECLCTLCENLLTLIPIAALPVEAQSRLGSLPEQIAAVRASADDIRYQQALHDSTTDDPYTLAALGQWAWRE